MNGSSYVHIRASQIVRFDAASRFVQSVRSQLRQIEAENHPGESLIDVLAFLIQQAPRAAVWDMALRRSIRTGLLSSALLAPEIIDLGSDVVDRGPQVLNFEESDPNSEVVESLYTLLSEMIFHKDLCSWAQHLDASDRSRVWNAVMAVSRERGVDSAAEALDFSFWASGREVDWTP